MGQQGVEGFLAMLTRGRWVESATYNQALSALPFLYREVHGIDLSRLDGMQHLHTPKHSLGFYGGRGSGAAVGVVARYGLACRLLYGTGIQPIE